MLGGASPALDLSVLLQFACTALALIAAALFVVKKTASRYFVVDAGFESNEFQARRSMLVGGSDAGGAGVSECPTCARPARKRCSRCKSVWYCSELCQSKHWKEEHKLNCRVTSDKLDIRRTVSRRKSSAISLVPDHGALELCIESKKILFPYDEFVKLFNWDKPCFPPCGLLNCGNSCFANVILQCLASTRPLLTYLLEKDHNRGCLRRRDDWCFLCELQVHIKRCNQSSLPFSPINILSRLPNIGGNLGYGRQEDAHEFMRFAIDTMQSICLDEFGGEKAVDLSTQETTFVQYIFGGYLQSQVICTNCDAISNRYENMMDLTVEIHGDSESLEECLDQFTVKEWLDGDNMYKCDGCNSYVKAWKRLTVHMPPNVLTIALKRFQSGRFGKLNKRVTFPENLDLSPYMSADGDDADHYTLYGVIVHLDMLNASFFGHYICYTKDYQGLWYKVDDCKVIKVEVEEVLAQNAYMLLYHRRNPRTDPFVKSLDSSVKPHFAETDPEISKTLNSPRLSACAIISSSLTSELQSGASNSEMFSNFSVREAGRDVPLQESTAYEPENMILDAPAAAAAYPVSVLVDDRNADGLIHSLSEINGLEPENLNRLGSIRNPLPLEMESSECKEVQSFSHPELQIKECKDSMGDKLIFEPQIQGLYASSSSLKHEKQKKSSENGSIAKEKPIFAPGFLDKLVKKPVSRQKTEQIENHRTHLSSKINGHANGHFEIAKTLINENAEPANSRNSFTASVPNGFDKVECNGKSCNEIAATESGQRQPCCTGQTHAENCTSSCNSSISKTGNCSPTLLSKIAECHQDDNQRLGQSNGLNHAHFSDELA